MLVDILLHSLCSETMSVYDIVIFAEDIVDFSNYDACSLMLLAGINAACKDNIKKPRIIMEMLDPKNAELAQTANADDMIYYRC